MIGHILSGDNSSKSILESYAVGKEWKRKAEGRI